MRHVGRRPIPARDRSLRETIDRGIEQRALRLVMGDTIDGERLDGCRRALNGGACRQQERETGERIAGLMRGVH